MPRLDLRICAARNLPNIETFGKIDPYCTVSLEGRQWRTQCIENTCDPEWNEVFKFHVADPDSSRLHFVIWDEDVGRDEFIGEYYLSISGLDRGQVEDKWVLLQNCKSNAELHVRIMAVDFGDVDMSQMEPETPPAPVYRPMPPTYQPPVEQQQYYRPVQRVTAPGIETFFGRPMNLRSCHGTHVRALEGGENAGVDMQDKPPAEWERLTLAPHRDGVMIVTCHGTHLRALPDGNINQAVNAAEWETWYPEQLPNGSFRFRSFHNKWLRGCQGGEGAPLNQSDAPAQWEEWRVNPLGVQAYFGRHVTLRTCHGTHARAQAGGENAAIDLQDKPPAEWERFHIRPHRDGVMFATCHGTHIRALPDGNINQAVNAAEWETWYPEQLPNGAFRFRSFHNKWLRGCQGGEGAPVNQADSPAQWEEWHINFA